MELAAADPRRGPPDRRAGARGRLSQHGADHDLEPGHALCRSTGGSLGFLRSDADGDDEQELRRDIETQLKKTFRPEFLNRVDDVIIFHNLTREHMLQIVDLQMRELGRAAARARGRRCRSPRPRASGWPTRALIRSLARARCAAPCSATSRTRWLCSCSAASSRPGPWWPTWKRMRSSLARSRRRRAGTRIDPTDAGTRRRCWSRRCLRPDQIDPSAGAGRPEPRTRSQPTQIRTKTGRSAAVAGADRLASR